MVAFADRKLRAEIVFFFGGNSLNELVFILILSFYIPFAKNHSNRCLMLVYIYIFNFYRPDQK